MKYFTLIEHELNCKNNLDKAGHVLLSELNRCIISADNIKWYKDQINEAVEKLNAQFKRCKPLKPDWFYDHVHKDWFLYGVGSCRFGLYASKD